MTEQILQFGEWLPDEAVFNNPGIFEARNVVPKFRGYGPFKDLEGTGVSTGVNEYATFLHDYKDGSENTVVLAGTSVKLLRAIPGGLSFEDITRSAGASPYNGSDVNRWRAAQFGENVYLVNNIDTMQKVDLTVGGDAVDSPGAAALLLGAKDVTVVRDFLVLGNTIENQTTRAPYRVRWSGLGTPEGDWTPSGITLAGFQDIPDLGPVQRVLGGEYGTVLLDEGLVRMNFIGPPVIFSFDQVEDAAGCFVASSAIRVKGGVYYLGTEGWKMFDGQRTHNIGVGKVDTWFFRELNIDFKDRISVIADEENHLIFWAFPGQQSVNGYPNKILIYDYARDKFSYADFSNAFLYGDAKDLMTLGRSASVGFTLDTLDTVNPSIDDLPASLDSRIWKGGLSVLAAIRATDASTDPADNTGLLETFTGQPRTASISTNERQLQPGLRAHLRELWPQVQGDVTVEADIAVRDKQNQLPPVFEFGALQEPDSGLIPCRVEGRFHTVRLRITSGTSGWDAAIGVRAESEPAGGR